MPEPLPGPENSGQAPPKKRSRQPGPRKPSRKALVEEYLQVRKPAEIDRSVLGDLRSYVFAGLKGSARISEAYLLELLEQSDIPIAREIGGLPPDLRGRVHFHDLAAAEASLLDLSGEYAKAGASGGRERMEDIRRAVLRGKNRLQLLARQPNLSAEKRTEKKEILAWFRVWLETPGLFRQWLDLRKAALQSGPSGEPPR